MSTTEARKKRAFDALKTVSNSTDSPIPTQLTTWVTNALAARGGMKTAATGSLNNFVAGASSVSGLQVPRDVSWATLATGDAALQIGVDTINPITAMAVAAAQGKYEVREFSFESPSFPVPFALSNYGDIPSYVASDAEFPGDYTSGIIAPLVAKIVDALENGGTGLDTDVEGAIYDRHMSRVEDEQAQLVDGVSVYWGARGFTMPPGMLSAGIVEAHDRVVKNNMDVSRDIMISQAELAQRNTHFFVEQAVSIEQVLRTFYYSLVQTAQAKVQAHLQENSFLLERYRLALESYAADIQRFSAIGDYEGAAAQAFNASYSADASVRSAEWNAKGSHALAEANRADAQAKIYQQRIQALVGRMQSVAKSIEGVVDFAKSIETSDQGMHSNMLGAAINGLNASVSMSAQASIGESQSVNTGTTTSIQRISSRSVSASVSGSTSRSAQVSSSAGVQASVNASTQRGTQTSRSALRQTSGSLNVNLHSDT